MRIIEGQIIATTTLDRHGERIPKEGLQILFDKMPDEQYLNQNHDLSKPIVGRLFNKAFVALENDEFAIRVDVEVYDEELFAKFGGISIAFTRRSYTSNPTREPEIELLFNPAIIDAEDILPISRLSNRSIQINSTELHQKSVDTIGIIVIAFISSSIAAGFFKEVGADIYKAFKSKLVDLGEKYRTSGRAELKFHFRFTATLGSKDVDVLVISDTDELSIVLTQGILIEPILQTISAYAESGDISRATIGICKELPYLEITDVRSKEGKAAKFLEYSPRNQSTLQ